VGSWKVGSAKEKLKNVSKWLKYPQLGKRQKSPQSIPQWIISYQRNSPMIQIFKKIPSEVQYHGRTPPWVQDIKAIPLWVVKKKFPIELIKPLRGWSQHKFPSETWRKRRIFPSGSHISKDFLVGQNCHQTSQQVFISLVNYIPRRLTR